MVSRVTHMTILLESICVLSVWNQACQSSCVKPEMSGLPNRAKYKQLKTICEHTCDSSSIDSSSSVFLFASSPSISYDHATVFALRFFHLGIFSCCCCCRNSWLEHFSVLVNNAFVQFAFKLSASQLYVLKKWCWFSKFNKFHQCLPHRIEGFSSFLLGF